MKSLYILVFYCSAFFLISCNSEKSNNNDNQNAEVSETATSDSLSLDSAQMKVSDINVGKMELHVMGKSVSVNGSVDALNSYQASVSIPFGGQVNRLLVTPGCNVKRGQTIAFISNPLFLDIQQQYLEAKYKLEFSNSNYQRQKSLFSKDASSKKNMEQSFSDYQTLLSQKKMLAQKLLLIGFSPDNLLPSSISRMVALKSPMSGTVNSVNVTIGQTVSDNEPLVNIVDSRHLILKLSVFEKDITSLAKGQKVIFRVNGSDSIFNAVVFSILPLQDADKSYKVYAAVTRNAYALKLGMYVNAKVITEPMSVYSLPDGAVVSYGGKDYVFVQTVSTSNKFSFRLVQVKKGFSDAGYTQIFVPLELRDSFFVTRGAMSLLAVLKNRGEDD
jgi:cobalt-zinc-cadmium efflux system membrane fusion protein